MTISELIERLEALKAEHGDLEVGPDHPEIEVYVVNGWNRPDYLEIVA